MSESLSDAVRDRARADMETWLARVNVDVADLTMYDRGMIAGAGVGAQEVAGRLPSRDEISLAIAKTMPGWNEDTEDGDLTSHWERVNATCIESGGSYADAILSLIREHVTRG